jgi:predicted MFS family arabinose efflux permease
MGVNESVTLLARRRRLQPTLAPGAGDRVARLWHGAAMTAGGILADDRETARRWRVLLALALAVAVTNGFARFAYGLILPAMREDLGWTYAEAGSINTSNAFGYLAGALLSLPLLRHMAAEKLFAVSMVGTGAALLLSGLTADFVLLTIFRVAAGLAGAPTFIAGGALAARLFPGDARRGPLAIGIYVSGGGVGMVLSGAVLPALFAASGPAMWPLAWIALGTASLLFAVPAVLAARWPGWHASAPARGRGTQWPPARRMFPELAGYTLFGVGYIVYLTFLVAWLGELGASTLLVTLTWVTVGLGIIASPYLWQAVMQRSAGGLALALTTGATGAGILLAVIVPGPAGLLASAAVFGLSVFMAPGAVTAFSRRNLLPEAVPGGVALFTAVFAAGQIVGPVAAGALADWTGSVGDGLLAAGLILAAGAAVAALQRPLSPPSR